MAGDIRFDVSHINNCIAEEKLSYAFTDRVKELGVERNIKVPNRIRVGGFFGNYIYVCYSSNAVRDLIVEVGQELKLPILPK